VKRIAITAAAIVVSCISVVRAGDTPKVASLEARKALWAELFRRRGRRDNAHGSNAAGERGLREHDRVDARRRPDRAAATRSG